jgi:hypothetical protein
MSFGIQLRNENNQIMFSSDFAAFHFAGKFTATKIVDPNHPFNYQVTFSCNGNPLVFTEGLDSVGVPSRTCTLEVINIGGNTWTAVVYFLNTGGPLATIPVYVFAFASTPSPTGFSGFVQSQSGVTMLNLQQRVLKISGAHKTTAKSSPVVADPPPETLFSGTIPADYIMSCVQVAESARSNGPSIPGGFFGMTVYRINSTTIGYTVADSYGLSPTGVDAYRVYENQYILFADRTLYQ